MLPLEIENEEGLKKLAEKYSDKTLEEIYFKAEDGKFRLQVDEAGCAKLMDCDRDRVLDNL